MTALVPVPPDELAAAEVAEARELAAAAAYSRASLAASTRKKYAADWNAFGLWCRERKLATLPASPETVARYVAWLADAKLSVSTIRRVAAAIARAHESHGHANPCTDPIVRTVMSGVARTHGTAPRRQKAALDREDLRALVRLRAGEELRDVRDRAVMLLGFALGARRSEIAALNVDDLTWTEHGVTVTIRRSKTDQEGRGHEVGVPRVKDEELCAVRALEHWLKAAEIADGIVFRSFGLPRGRRAKGELQNRWLNGRDVALIIQRAARDAELDGDFGGHSLRAGLITSATTAGVPLTDAMKITGHRSMTTAMHYVRRATLYTNSPLAAIMTAPRRKN